VVSEADCVKIDDALPLDVGGSHVPVLQSLIAGVVVQVTADELVAGSPGAGDGLRQQLPGASRVDAVAADQVRHQALAKQDIVDGLIG
jgi:hypothetical protein